MEENFGCFIFIAIAILFIILFVWIGISIFNYITGNITEYYCVECNSKMQFNGDKTMITTGKTISYITTKNKYKCPKCGKQIEIK